MRRLEVLELTASDREAAIQALEPFRAEEGARLRMYRPTELAVHILPAAEGGAEADALPERIAALLETHGLLSRSQWVLEE